MGIYRELRAAGITTRAAARLLHPPGIDTNNCHRCAVRNRIHCQAGQLPDHQL